MTGSSRGRGGRRQRRRKAVRDFSNVAGVVNVALYIQFLFLEVH